MAPTTTKVPQNAVSVLQRAQWICNTIFHQLVAVVGVFILWTLCFNFENTLSRWHMILAGTAYLPLMCEAIVLFSNDNVWTQKIPRTVRYNIHGAMLFTSAVFATVGISFMVAGRTTHFKSTHGWTGLVSWIFVLLSQILGIAAIKAQSFSSFIRPVCIKFVHNLFGMLGYAFGLVSLCYGLDKRTFKITSPESRQAAVIVIGIIGAWSLIAALKSAYNQLKTLLGK